MWSCSCTWGAENGIYCDFDVMKGTRWITAAIAYQLLFMLVMFGGAVYLVWLTHEARVRGGPGAADEIFGLEIGTAGAGVPALAGIAGCMGLWRRRRWGWWVTLMVDAVLVSVFVSGMISDVGDIDAALVAFTVASVVGVILFLLPVVRRSYWSTSAAASIPG